MIRTARTILLLAAGLLTALLGFAAGRTGADLLPSGVDAVAVSVVEPGAAPEWAASPVSLIRTGGERVVAIDGAYYTTTIAQPDARALFLDIARDAAGWADRYPMSGAVDPETTVLRIWGARPRTIRIESLFTNPDVPTSLLAAVGAAIRTENQTAAVPFAPSGIRLSVERVAATGGEPLFAAPPIELAAADGRVLAAAEAADLAVAWPPIGSIRPFEAHAHVLQGQVLYRVGWTVDWEPWIASGTR